MSKRIQLPYRATGATEDPRNINYNILGLHKVEHFDGNGDKHRVEYFLNYDEVNEQFIDLAILEERVYTRDANTGLLSLRLMTITWYDTEGVIGIQKIDIPKRYSAKKGFTANKRARQNLIDNASMYLYSQLLVNDPLTADANVDDYEGLTNAAQSKYINSNTTPLLEVITNSTDNTKPEYRAYITEAMRDTLLGILNVSYKQ